MSIISVQNFKKSYGEKILFDNISFTIAEKQRIGLIGVNGTGKSTLLKVVAGLDSKEAGEITHANDFHIAYLPQYPVFAEHLTVFEQIYYGNSPLIMVLRDYEKAVLELEDDPNNREKQDKLSLMQQKMDQFDAWEASTVAKTVLTRLGIKNFSQPVRELSGGQRKRVAIAKALIQPADLLLLDEPTNHLDNEIIEWLEQFLAQYKGALLVVTHDRYFLNRVTNGIFELEQGKLYSYEGNYEAFLTKKAEREELEIAGAQKRENILRKELAWLRRGAKARSTKQKARIERIEQLQNHKTNIEKNNIDIVLGSQRLGKKVLELKNVTKAYDSVKLIDNYSYQIVPNERLGIIGPNGTGKTTLLNIIAGSIVPDTGIVEKGATVRIGYYTQDYEEMDGDLRVIEYVREGAEVIRTTEGQLITAEQLLERFLFSRSMQWTYIRKLSGGERRRLYLLRKLMEEPNVLLLDEPTNDLDIQTLTILEDYLESFPGVVITVSHDRYFLDKVVDHLIAFEGEGIIRYFAGNYTQYLEMKKEEELASNLVSKEKITSVIPQERKKRKKLSYKEQQEWDVIEEKITILEERNTQIKKNITSAGSDYELVQKLYQEQQQIEQELESTIERWTELSLLIEEIKQEN